MRLAQVDLLPRVGGAEKHARFCCRAFSRLGLETRGMIHPAARFWSQLDPGSDTGCIPIDDPAAATTHGELVIENARGRWPS